VCDFIGIPDKLGYLSPSRNALTAAVSLSIRTPCKNTNPRHVAKPTYRLYLRIFKLCDQSSINVGLKHTSSSAHIDITSCTDEIFSIPRDFLIHAANHGRCLRHESPGAVSSRECLLAQIFDRKRDDK